MSRVAVPVVDSSQVGEARRVAVALAQKFGFGETDAGRVALVATEAATNLLKHGGGGELLIGPVEHRRSSGLELLALDRGAGIKDLELCRRDGYSTSGSSGTGLGAIDRLSSFSDVYSAPGLGTALLARLFPGPPAAWNPAPAGHFEIGAVCIAMPGEQAPGDAWAAANGHEGITVMIADGLGHGPQAASASSRAVAVFIDHAGESPAEVLECMHGPLRNTRGAAVSVARFEPDEGLIRFAGVGNVNGIILSAAGRRAMVTHGGTVGHQVPNIQEFAYPWSGSETVVLYSDGLASHWNLDSYPGLLTRDTSLIAGVLYRDFSRRRDDVTVVVLRSVQ